MALHNFESAEEYKPVIKELKVWPIHYPDKKDISFTRLGRGHRNDCCGFCYLKMALWEWVTSNHQWVCRSILAARHLNLGAQIQWSVLEGLTNITMLYYKDAFRDGMRGQMKMVFGMKWVFTNIKLMVTFVRKSKSPMWLRSWRRMIAVRGKKKFWNLYMMPGDSAMSLQAEEFAKPFWWLLIGSNDLTQLTLGADRDSELLRRYLFLLWFPAVNAIDQQWASQQKPKGWPGCQIWFMWCKRRVSYLRSTVLVDCGGLIVFHFKPGRNA